MSKHFAYAFGALAASLTLVVPLTASLSATPATAATTWTTKAYDNFNRSVSSSWGTADKGGRYLSQASKGVAYKVKKDEGRAVVSNLVTGSTYASALPVALDDTTARIGMYVTQGSKTIDLYHGFQARKSADGKSYYSITYRSNAAGGVSLTVSRVVNGVATRLADAPLTIRPSWTKKMWLEYQLTGTSPVQISARAWYADATTPSWQVSTTDSASSRITAAGTVALTDYVAKVTGSAILRYDNLLVQGRAATTTTPTPTPTPTPTATATATATATPKPTATATTTATATPTATATATATATPTATATATASATPTATATVTAVSTGSRGTTLGSARYTVPSGAVYVSSTSGNDSTGTGSASAPYQTVAKALAVAPTGGTVVLRAGSYHEAVTVSRAVTIQNYPGEVVWFDGSKSVTNWTQSGSTWVATGWTAKHSWTIGGDYARYIDADNMMANHPDMVFVNGTQLSQVSSAAAVTTGKFYYDEAASKLIIGTDPTGKDVRASDLEQALKVIASSVNLQGFGVHRYATPVEGRGAILSDPATGVLRDLVVSDNASIGMSVNRPGKTIDHVLVERNGVMGIGANKATDLTLTNSVIRNNNSENFKAEPIAGGVKITSSSNVTVKNNEISNTLGASGLWFDCRSWDVTIVSNDVTNNDVNQIEYEISKDAIIANNVATGGQKGILLFDAENIRVFNNEVGGYSQFGIKVAQDSRPAVEGDSTFTLLSRYLTISNNVFGTGKLFQFYALDGVGHTPADAMAITLNGNLFNKRVVSSDPTMVAWGQADNVTLVRYETPTALASAKNSGWKNAQSSTAMLLSTMASLIDSSQSVAVGLPADVAAAIGKSAGYKAVGIIG